MKKRILCSICFIFIFILSSCGKNTDTLDNSSQAEKGEETVENSIEPEQKREENQIPDSYAASVVVTINPQVKLYLDADNIIIGVEYLNEDARTAFADIDFSGITLKEGMSRLVEAAVECKFLTDGKDITIEVTEVTDLSCDANAISKEIENAVADAVGKSGVEANISVQVVAENLESGEAISETVTTEEPDSEEDTTGNTSSDVAQNACTVCGGTGKCDECKGDGYRGIGYTVSCPRCHGSLTETCIYCDASGNSTKHAGICDFPNCMGAHVYTCTICGGGTTPVTCRSCGGSGKCNTCGGGGTQ